MKTRLLIIIGIIIAITISVSVLIIIDNIMSQSEFPPLIDDSDVTVVFTDFADNFSVCSFATFNLTTITRQGESIYVIADITDDCKIHVIRDNRATSIDGYKLKFVDAQCDNLTLEEDFIGFENCIMSKNSSGSFRFWKDYSHITAQPYSKSKLDELYTIRVENERKEINSLECSELLKKYDGKMHTIFWDVRYEFVNNAMDNCKNNSSMIEN